MPERGRRATSRRRRDLERPLDAAVRGRIGGQLLRWGRSHFVTYPWRTETDGWRTFCNGREPAESRLEVGGRCEPVEPRQPHVDEHRRDVL
jgi:hypothetical protein